MRAKLIKEFDYGASRRSLYRLSEPLPDHYPDRFHILRVAYPWEGGRTWLALASSSGAVAGHCLTDREREIIKAAIAAA